MSVCVGICAQSEPQALEATLASLRRHTRDDVTLAVVPDAPDVEVGRALADAGLPVIAGGVAGGAAALNRLLRWSPADIVVLLESGCVVEAGWLDPLVAALADPCTGLAGPTTNRGWNEQAAGRDGVGDGVVSLAPLHSIGDFCLAVHRRTAEAIGAADEGFGVGPCWELEYAARAARAGLRSVWATASFVWRAPPTARRARAEAARFEAARRRYQERLCGRRLPGGEGGPYRGHCRGDDCPNFAPADRIELVVDLGGTAARSNVTRPRLDVVVSAVMPTTGRRDWALQAVRYFERQRGVEAELVVVCDEGDELPRELTGLERVRCIATPRGTSIGAKRNAGAAAAHGEIVAQWDDDDWYGPDRLARQAAPIAGGHADMTALRLTHALDIATGEFWTPSRALHRRLFVGDVHGGTLAFRRSLWAHGTRYPDSSLAEDATLLRTASRAGVRLHRIDGAGLFVYVRHGANTWRMGPNEPDSGGEWRRSVAPEAIAPDLGFYATRGKRTMLVSAIMPTADRRPFIPRALDCFAAQDHPLRELLVLDDGADSVGDLMPRDDPRIRYVRLERPLALGEKRNLACRLASGPLIAHWDDDDWYAPHRLRYQSGELQRTKADITGQDRLLFADPAARAAWRYAHQGGGRQWVAGSSMCYRRTAWQRSPFPPLPTGEDTAFVWRSRGRVHAHDDVDVCVAVIHPGATSDKDTGGVSWEPRPFSEAQAILGPDAARWLA